jgi:hypothetical protein
MHIRTLLILAFTLLPLSALAYHVPGHAGRDFAWFIRVITDLIRVLIIFIFALTFLTLIWSVIKGWIIGGGEPEGIESGKKIVLAGIIALIVMCSIWGILYLLQRSLFG